jgi:hypothetical protein
MNFLALKIVNRKQGTEEKSNWSQIQELNILEWCPLSRFLKTICKKRVRRGKFKKEGNRSKHKISCKISTLNFVPLWLTGKPMFPPPRLCDLRSLMSLIPNDCKRRYRNLMQSYRMPWVVSLGSQTSALKMGNKLFWGSWYWQIPNLIELAWNKLHVSCVSSCSVHYVDRFLYYLWKEHILYDIQYSLEVYFIYDKLAECPQCYCGEIQEMLTFYHQSFLSQSLSWAWSSNT